MIDLHQYSNERLYNNLTNVNLINSNIVGGDSIEHRKILLNKKGDIENEDEVIINFFKRNKKVIKYIREYFYIFVFFQKIIHNKENCYDLCFYEKEIVFYQKKLKEYYLKRNHVNNYNRCMKNKIDNYKFYDKYGYAIPSIQKMKKGTSNDCNDNSSFMFLYNEVNICNEEKRFGCKEYAYMVYPYLLLLSDFIKRMIHIYKEDYVDVIKKLFIMEKNKEFVDENMMEKDKEKDKKKKKDVKKKKNKIEHSTFLYKLENIMSRSIYYFYKDYFLYY